MQNLFDAAFVRSPVEVGKVEVARLTILANFLIIEIYFYSK